MQKKQGISLIVLVITIIVMIILAATVVISLSNTGIIDRAGQAVDLTNEASVQDLAALTWADAYMNNKRGSELVTEVTTKLEDYGVTEDNWDIKISDTGVTVVFIETLPKFAINNEKYCFLNQMTWPEWVLSKYNTIGLIDTGSEIRTADGDYYLTENGVNPVYGKIEGGITYKLEFAGDTNAPTNDDLI